MPYQDVRIGEKFYNKILYYHFTSHALFFHPYCLLFKVKKYVIILQLNLLILRLLNNEF